MIAQQIGNSNRMVENDQHLIIQCQQGDRQAFNRLVMQYQHLVYNFLYRLAPAWDDVDDLAQEVFIKVYRSVHHLKDVTQFISWLHRIAVRVYLDAHRKRKKHRERFVDDELALEQHADPQTLPAAQSGQQDAQQILQEALAELPAEFKLAIILREVQDLSYAEIAETLQCSIGTVRSRIFRGRQLLQTKLKDQL